MRFRFEAQHGAGSVSAFGSYTWDADMLLSNAVPVALKTAKPGTPEFVMHCAMHWKRRTVWRGH